MDSVLWVKVIMIAGRGARGYWKVKVFTHFESIEEDDLRDGKDCD